MRLYEEAVISYYPCIKKRKYDLKKIQNMHRSYIRKVKNIR